METRKTTEQSSALAGGLAWLGVGLGLGRTALDVVVARAVARTGSGRGGVHVVKSITINRSPAETYRMWRDFGNLPRFMVHVEAVDVLDGRRSHWRATGPAGRSIEWDTEIIEDLPDQCIGWRSTEGSVVTSGGVVRFASAPGGRGTEVHVDLRYDPPGGSIGATMAKLFDKDPGQLIEGDLRRFKQVLETGEVVLSDASIDRGRHPARPARRHPHGGA
jgi:uncharacterized membrane protein